MAEEKLGEDVSEQSVVAVCQFKCKNCQGQIASRLPTMRVFNFPESSGVVVAHERMAKCPKCDTLYVPLIGQVTSKGEIQFIWRPLPTAGNTEVENLRRM